MAKPLRNHNPQRTCEDDQDSGGPTDVLVVDVSEDLSKGMRASTKQFMEKHGPRVLFQRLKDYRNGTGSFYTQGLHENNVQPLILR